MKIETIDLKFRGRDEIIGSFLLVGRSSAALVETGPSTCIKRLMEGLRERGVAPNDVKQIFLTHIHLDHAGASGNICELLPNATFYVHEAGLPHLVDPSKLLKSAGRIYGDQMESLWGEVRPVPEDRLKALRGGEELQIAGRTLLAHYTPGHAYHHLAYYEPESGALFTGDVAGVRLPGQSYVKPPTTPPEVDIEAWTKSIALIQEIAPESIWLTHFGPFEDVERHLSELEQRLTSWLLFVEQGLDRGLAQEDIAEELQTSGDAELLSAGADLEASERYEVAASYDMLVSGLVRYVTRRKER